MMSGNAADTQCPADAKAPTSATEEETKMMRDTPSSAAASTTTTTTAVADSDTSNNSAAADDLENFLRKNMPRGFDAKNVAKKLQPGGYHTEALLSVAQEKNLYHLGLNYAQVDAIVAWQKRKKREEPTIIEPSVWELEATS